MVELKEDYDNGVVHLSTDKMQATFTLSKDPVTDSMWVFSVSEGALHPSLMGMFTSKATAIKTFNIYEANRDRTYATKRKYFKDKREERDAAIPTEDG